MYSYIYVYICMCISIYIHIYIYIYVCMFACMYVLSIKRIRNLSKQTYKLCAFCFCYIVATHIYIGYTGFTLT